MNADHPPDTKNAQPVMLSGTGVTKFFGGLAAVSRVDFVLHEHEILGLIGPNGAGKTTLFNLIAGVLKPNQGMITFREEPIHGLRPDIICRRGIARTFQITKPFLEMSALENVMLGSYFGSVEKRHLKECRRQSEDMLSMVGLEDKTMINASLLTLVERKRLELARALSTHPSILLLDEVIAGLNPTEAMEMVDLIRKIQESGMAILMIEHVMKAIMGLSDRIIVLNYGEKIAEGSPDKIVSNPLVIEAYLGGMADAHSK